MVDPIVLMSILYSTHTYTIYSINYFLDISSGALGQLGHDISLGLLLD